MISCQLVPFRMNRLKCIVYNSCCYVYGLREIKTCFILFICICKYCLHSYIKLHVTTVQKKMFSSDVDVNSFREKQLREQFKAVPLRILSNAIYCFHWVFAMGYVILMWPSRSLPYNFSHDLTHIIRLV